MAKTMSATKAEGRRIRCRHFTGAQNKTCRAGLNYRELVSGDEIGWMARIPCLPESPLRKEPRAKCDKYADYTDAELEAEQRESNDRIAHTGEAIKRIRETKLDQGSIECPKCQKRLGFSVAKTNGHVWGRCETKGCLAWMM